MKTLTAVQSAFLLGAGIFLLAWAFYTCGRRGEVPEEKLPPDVVHRIDSLAATATAFRTRAESLATVIKHDTIRVARIVTRTDTLLQRVTVTERSADSLAALREWESAFRTERSVNDTLHTVIDSLQTAVSIERNAVDVFRGLYVADTLRRSAVEKVNTDLQQAVARLERPCKILGPVPCPSRTVTFIATALVTIGVLSSTR